MDKSGIIYKITNKVNGKIYIGQTIQALEKRWRFHVRGAGKSSSMPICRAIRKYGEDNFELSIICSASNRDELDSLEEKYISEMNSLVPSGYNLRAGGHSSRLHPDSIEKMREAHKNRPPISEETHAKLSAAQLGNKNMLGKHHSEETRKKIGDGNRGKIVSDETREKIRRVRTGTKLSEETRAKIGLESKRIGISKETRAKMAMARKGRPRPEAVRIKIRNALLGRHVSDELRKKLSDSHKGKKHKYPSVRKGRTKSVSVDQMLLPTPNPIYENPT